MNAQLLTSRLSLGALLALLLGLFLPLTPVSASPFALPPYKTMKLKNGVTLLLMEQHEVPLIYISIATPGGAINDGQKFGLADMTADALRFGTKSYTRSQLEDELDYLGASLSASVNQDASFLECSFGAKDRDVVLNLLKEVLLFPTFEPKEVEQAKQLRVDELTMAKESPGSVAMDYSMHFFFGAHPYGNPLSGTPATIKALTPEELRAFYQAWYQPSQMIISVVGDFSSAPMAKQMQTLFGTWKSSSPAPARVNLKEGLAAPQGPKVLLVDKPDSIETTYRVLGPGIPRNHPDFIPVMVVNTVLGARFTSWLNSELRIKSGLTYGARSTFQSFRDTGVFVVSSFTRTENTQRTLELTFSVLERLHKEGIDQATLDSAKAYVKGQFPPRYETSGQLASLLTAMAIYGLDASFINDFEKNIDSLTVAKARDIIARYFPAKNFQLVVIGKAEVIRPVLEKYGPITVKQITDEGY